MTDKQKELAGKDSMNFRNLAATAAALALAVCSGCGKELSLRIVGVFPGEGEDASSYVLRNAHTLVEETRPNGRRMVLPGALGTPGETVRIRNAPYALYY